MPPRIGRALKLRRFERAPRRKERRERERLILERLAMTFIPLGSLFETLVCGLPPLSWCQSGPLHQVSNGPVVSASPTCDFRSCGTSSLFPGCERVPVVFPMGTPAVVRNAPFGFLPTARALWGKRPRSSLLEGAGGVFFRFPCWGTGLGLRCGRRFHREAHRLFET